MLPTAQNKQYTAKMHQHLPLAAILATFTSLVLTQGIDPNSVPIGTRREFWVLIHCRGIG